MTELYKATLRELVLTDHLLQDLNNDKWNQLNDLITPEVLQAAYDAGMQFQFTQDYARRDLKTMERINVKKAMVGRPDLGFKTNCDLMAFRIFTYDVAAIPEIVNNFKTENEAKGNVVLVRPNLYGPDIVQYFYIYDVQSGFLAEYQCGHRFAALKFKHDSGIRDGLEGSLDFSKTTVKVYKIVKEHLLAGDLTKDLFVETWKAGFGGIEPSDEWLGCFKF